MPLRDTTCGTTVTSCVVSGHILIKMSLSIINISTCMQSHCPSYMFSGIVALTSDKLIRKTCPCNVNPLKPIFI